MNHVWTIGCFFLLRKQRPAVASAKSIATHLLCARCQRISISLLAPLVYFHSKHSYVSKPCTILFEKRKNTEIIEIKAQVHSSKPTLNFQIENWSCHKSTLFYSCRFRFRFVPCSPNRSPLSVHYIARAFATCEQKSVRRFNTNVVGWHSVCALRSRTVLPFGEWRWQQISRQNTQCSFHFELIEV